MKTVTLKEFYGITFWSFKMFYTLGEQINFVMP